MESVKPVKTQQEIPGSSAASTALAATLVSLEATAPFLQEIKEHIHNRLNYLNKLVDWVKKKVQERRSPWGTSESRQPEVSASSRSEGDVGDLFLKILGNSSIQEGTDQTTVYMFYQRQQSRRHRNDKHWRGRAAHQRVLEHARTTLQLE